MDEILKQTKGDNNMYSYPLSDMFQRAEAKGYAPYCDIEFDPVIEHYSIPDQATNNPEPDLQSQLVLRHCPHVNPEACKASFNSVSSTLCSLSEPIDRSSALKNVSHMHALFHYHCAAIASLSGFEVKL